MCISERPGFTVRGLISLQANILFPLNTPLPVEPRWGRSCRRVWRSWWLTLSYWVQPSRGSSSARRTCGAQRGSAQKSQSPLGNCRLRCATRAVVVREYCKCSHFPHIWPLGRSATTPVSTGASCFLVLLWVLLFVIQKKKSRDCSGSI